MNKLFSILYILTLGWNGVLAGYFIIGGHIDPKYNFAIIAGFCLIFVFGYAIFLTTKEEK